jgi:uncharacterized protein YdbL (DUF1318 family)
MIGLLRVLRWVVFVGLLAGMGIAQAAANLEIDTPAIAALQRSQQARHSQLAPYYASGAVGLTRDAMVAVRDASAVPLAQRARVNELVADENRDRTALYREIARANGHPEWEADVRATFAERWIAKAPAGWYVQSPGGEWVRK